MPLLSRWERVENLCNGESGLAAAQVCGDMWREWGEPDQKEKIWINNLPPSSWSILPSPKASPAFFSFFFNISNQFSTSAWLLTGISEVLRQRGGFGKGADLQQLLLNRHMGSSLCPFLVSNCIVLLLLPKGCTLHYMEIYSRAQINGHECFYYL